MTVTVELPIDRSAVPEIVTTRWCADTFGVTQSAILAAIHDGRISATRFGSVWALRSEDALEVWGHLLLRRARQKRNV